MPTSLAERRLARDAAASNVEATPGSNSPGDHAGIAERLLSRNEVCRAFFDREAHPLARACQEMVPRFLQGGRLLACGNGPYATEACLRTRGRGEA